MDSLAGLGARGTHGLEKKARLNAIKGCGELAGGGALLAFSPLAGPGAPFVAAAGASLVADGARSGALPTIRSLRPPLLSRNPESTHNIDNFVPGAPADLNATYRGIKNANDIRQNAIAHIVDSKEQDRVKWARRLRYVYPDGEKKAVGAIVEKHADDVDVRSHLVPAMKHSLDHTHDFLLRKTGKLRERYETLQRGADVLRGPDRTSPVDPLVRKKKAEYDSAEDRRIMVENTRARLEQFSARNVRDLNPDQPEDARPFSTKGFPEGTQAEWDSLKLQFIKAEGVDVDVLTRKEMRKTGGIGPVLPEDPDIGRADFAAQRRNANKYLGRAFGTVLPDRSAYELQAMDKMTQAMAVRAKREAGWTGAAAGSQG